MKHKNATITPDNRLRVKTLVTCHLKLSPTEGETLKVLHLENAPYYILWEGNLYGYFRTKYTNTQQPIAIFGKLDRFHDAS